MYKNTLRYYPYTIVDQGFETLVLDVIIVFEGFANDLIVMFWVKKEDVSVCYENC